MLTGYQKNYQLSAFHLSRKAYKVFRELQSVVCGINKSVSRKAKIVAR